MSLPRAGTAQEIYLFNEVTVPPTVTTNAVQGGLRPGYPVQDKGVTRTEMVVTGRVRPATEPTSDIADKFPIMIKVLDYGAQTVNRGYAGRWGEGGGQGVEDTSTAIAPYSTLSAPRFAVIINAGEFGEQVWGVLPDFVTDAIEETGSPLPRLSGNANHSRQRGHAVAPVLDYKNNLHVAYLVKPTASNKVQILVQRLDRNREATWFQVANYDPATPILPYSPAGDTMKNRYEIAGTPYRGDMFFAVLGSVYGLYLFRLSADETLSQANRLEFIQGPIVVNSAVHDPESAPVTLRFIADAGLSFVATSTDLVIAVGGAEVTGSTLPVGEPWTPVGGTVEHRRIYFSARPAPQSWGGTVSTLNESIAEFSALDDFRYVHNFDGPGPLGTHRIGKGARFIFDDSGALLSSDEIGKYGWAAGPGGIARTTDGGQTWTDTLVPSSVIRYNNNDYGGLSSVAIAGRTGTAGAWVWTLYAVGTQGTILKSTDSGDTWKILRTNLPDIPEEDWVATGSFSDIGSTPLRGAAFKDANTGWVVGGLKVFRTTDGGTTWTEQVKIWSAANNNIIRAHKDQIQDSFMDCACFDDQLWVGGRFHVTNNSTGPLNETYAGQRSVMIIEDPSGSVTANDFMFTWTPTSFKDVRVNRLFKLVDSSNATPTDLRLYLAGTSGGLTFAEVGGTYPDLIQFVSPFFGEQSHLVGVCATNLSGGLRKTDTVCAVSLQETNDRPGRLYEKRPNANWWFSTAIENNETLHDVYRTHGHGLVVIGDGFRSGIFYGYAIPANRCYPHMVTLPSGEVLLACVNLTSAQIEIWRRPPNTKAFLLTTTLVPAEYGFTAFASVSTMWAADTLGPNAIPHPTLVIDEDDPLIDSNPKIFLTGDLGGRAVSQDLGRTWVKGDNTGLDLALGVIDAAAATAAGVIDEDARQSRTDIVANGGFIYSFIRTDTQATTGDIHCFIARKWSGIGLLPRPIQPNRPLAIGINGLKVMFLGAPAAQEQWLINEDYHYPARHLVVESPSVFYRSAGGSTTDDDDMVVWWNRQHADIVALLGNGLYWHTTAVSLFGCNVPTAQWRLSKNTYENYAPPTNGADFVSYPMHALLDSGANFNRYPNTNTASVVKMNTGGVNNRRWVPGQWASGSRQYWFGVGTQKPTGGGAVADGWTGQITASYRIIDNTVDELILDYDTTNEEDATPPNIDATLPAGGAWIIYSDRMVSVPTIGGSDTPYGQWFGLFVPRKTGGNAPAKDADGAYYRRLGTLLAGPHSTLNVTEPVSGNSFARERFIRGWRWQALTPIAEESTPSRVSAVEQMGRTLRRWSLTYDRMQWYDRDSVLNMMFRYPGRALGIVFDAPGNDGGFTENRTLELVRAPVGLEIANVGGDRSTYEIEIGEIA